MSIVTVQPLTGLDRRLSYTFERALPFGTLVKVPLRNRECLGIVVETAPDAPSRLKSVNAVVYDWPVVTPDTLSMAYWMQRYYACSLDSVFETIIPAVVRQEGRFRYEKVLSITKVLTEAELEVLQRRAPRQAEAYQALLGGPLVKSALVHERGIGEGILRALVEKGLFLETERSVDRNPYVDEAANSERVAAHTPLRLMHEQETALDSIFSSLDAGVYRTHLLHGVTGSGKTEIYLRAIHRVLEMGGDVVFLVPEVALTPQTVGRLQSRLELHGLSSVVWHSSLSNGERFDAWHALATGKSSVVVGARSAIFAPLKNIKLVIVDEEHEPAYKQSENPRYHGRDIAVYRAYLNKAVCILGSATPSLESLYNVKHKDYCLNRLTKRVDDRQMPLIHIVDMKMERLKNAALLSRTLASKLFDRFERKEQSILFINRRGYSTSLLCPDCGFVATCPCCSVALTFHRQDDLQKCHICGFSERAPQCCPQCASDKIRWRGFGTQKVEDVVQKMLPKARVVRVDTDSTQKDALRKTLADFRAGKIDILIGTQMIAKGLDFPNVTLVGLVDADISLKMPDFRAAERTFQLIVQVAGRSGRGDKAGEVVIQTCTPYSDPIQFAKRSDFDGFLEQELEQRKEFHYPPFRHLIRHLFRGHNQEKVTFVAEQWVRTLEASLPEKIEIRGPAPAPLEKIKDFYRVHVWYFTPNVSQTLQKILAIRSKFTSDPDVIDVFDVDPVDLS
ncbi:MAG: primosomal protein N' [Verrucomicrobia bacterium GWF2_51_19]|nr:MAG: primosomal protein N' [Verrucomicrobia bacterium GWF2_51_19]HCJ12128.1 primosomal protein N' [Opitutae bacterium]